MHHVLVVEDDPLDAELLTIWLNRTEAPSVITHCRTLREAVAKLREVRPDLILSDLALPDAQGVEAAEHLVSESPDVPLIVLTGSSRSDLATAALTAGAEDYINKDQLNEDTLRRAVRFAVTRHATQRRLVTLEGSLAEADAELEDYSSMVAHDLRAPLRTSRLLADAVAQQLEGQESTAADLSRRLGETLAELDELVLAMLDYTAMRSERIEAVQVEVLPVVQRVIDALEADIIDTNATFDILVDPNTQVLASDGSLWRVFENIISNSLKFRSAERPPRIVIEANIDGGQVLVTVRDNGIGIAPEYRDRVLRPLERLDRGVDGCGFGLAICRRQLRQLDGDIWIEGTEESDGTTVAFRLPAGRRGSMLVRGHDVCEVTGGER